ncbi:MAG: InlB B-repeat-containing protein [Bifidobacteriaceae bacterium]|jgi:uncharacterized repeat protein (TIGR02543 family)|nr:InlB B-repeat-containing protein [Bifidobacteriaceae bacterium]
MKPPTMRISAASALAALTAAALGLTAAPAALAAQTAADVPDLAIANTDITKQDDGVRDFTVTLYNRSATAPLAPSGLSVKLAFDWGGADPFSAAGEVTISDPAVLAQIDAGTYHHPARVNLAERVVEQAGLDEVPAGGVQLNIEATLISAGGAGVDEPDPDNNRAAITFQGLVELNGGRPFGVTSELTSALGATTANLQIRNHSIRALSDINATVMLLDDAGQVLDTKALAEGPEPRLGFGPEGLATATVIFDTLGTRVEVDCYSDASSGEDGLASLTLRGIGGELIRPGQVVYDFSVVNLYSTLVAARANDDSATVVISLAGSVLDQKPRFAAADVPLALGAVPGEAALTALRVRVIPPAGNPGRQIVDYSINVSNTRDDSTGRLLVSVAERGPGGWLNSGIVPEGPIWVRAVSEGAFDWTRDKLYVSTDNSPDAAVVGFDGTERDVVELVDDGAYRVSAYVELFGGERRDMAPVVLRLDRTPPQVGSIELTTAAEPVDGAPGTVKPSAAGRAADGLVTDRQVVVTALVSDGTSGVASVQARTSAGIVYPLTAGEAGVWTGVVDQPHAGGIAVVAADQAGNQIEAAAGTLQVFAALGAPKIAARVRSVTDRTALVDMTALFADSRHFASVTVRCRRTRTTAWTTLARIYQPGLAIGRTFALSGLMASRAHEVQVEAVDQVGAVTFSPLVAFTTRSTPPNAPRLLKKAGSSITVRRVNGVRVHYRIRAAGSKKWSDWSASRVFEGLKPGKAYQIQARRPAAGGVPASLESPALKVKTLKRLSVTFKPNGADAAQIVAKVQYRKTVAAPAAPERDGYQFTGWHTDPKAKQKHRFKLSKRVAEDLVLYAGWKKLKA